MPSRLAVAALSALLLAAGCTGDGTVRASPSPTASPTPLSATEAKAVAAAGVLTAADLPGFEVKAGTVDLMATKTGKSLSACLGTTYPAVLTSDAGRTFTKGKVDIDSSVEVNTSAADARAQYEALNSAKGQSCVKKLVGDAAALFGVPMMTVTVAPTSITVPGSDIALGFTFDFKGEADGEQLDLRGFSLAALVGQVSVELDMFAEPGADFPLTEATALLTKAVERVRAASSGVPSKA